MNVRFAKVKNDADRKNITQVNGSEISKTYIVSEMYSLRGPSKVDIVFANIGTIINQICILCTILFDSAFLKLLQVGALLIDLSIRYLKFITLCQGANANDVGLCPVSICPSRVFCGELWQLVISRH